MESFGPRRERLSWRERAATAIGRAVVLFGERIALDFGNAPHIVLEARDMRLAHEAAIAGGMLEIEAILNPTQPDK